MLSLNRATIIGNATRDPELRYTPNGQAVASFGVATNRSYNGADGERKETVEFHDIVTWGKLAEICNQILSKGRKVYVEGRIQTRQWEGQDGVKRQKTEIVAENVLVLDKPKEWNGSAPMAGSPDAAPSAPSTPPTPDLSSSDLGAGSAEVNLDDIPF